MAENDPEIRSFFDPATRDESRSASTARVFERTEQFEVPPAGAYDVDEEDGFNFVQMWWVLWHRRFWIAGAGIVGLAIALIASLLTTPLYRSTATLELNPPSVPILTASGSNENLVVPQSDTQFLTTQYGLMRSREIAERVVRNLNLGTSDEQTSDRVAAERQAASTVSNLISVQPVPGSRLVDLSYVSSNPTEAARIVNAYVDAYIESSMDRRYAATEKAREFLQDRLEGARIEVNDAERELVSYARANNLILTQGEEGSSSGSSLTGDSLTSLNSALAAAEQRRIAAEQRYRQGPAISEVNDSTQALRQELATLQAEYQEKSSYLKDSYPDMVRLRSRMDAIRTSISNQSGQARNSLRAEYQAALAEEQALRSKVAQLGSTMLSERDRSVQYNILQRELDTKRSLYDTLLARFNEVGVAASVGSAPAAVAEAGQVPNIPFTPNVPRNVILGLLLGLGLGAALAFAYDFLTDTIKTPEDVRDKLKLTTLGVIPKAKRKEDIVEGLENLRSPIAESYVSMIGSLKFSTRTGLPPIILVTSAMASEGKSTTSLAIAKYLAHEGRSVVLVDADMRKPSFRVADRADLGLSACLTSEDLVEHHVISTNDDDLWLMPSGPVPTNPVELLGSEKFEQILTRLSTAFDVVVVDAPPAHGFADAKILGSLVNGVVLVAQSGRTRRRMLLNVIASLRETRSTILGVALTKYASALGEYGYNYKYYEDYAALDRSNLGYALTSRRYERMSPLGSDKNSDPEADQ